MKHDNGRLSLEDKFSKYSGNRFDVCYDIFLEIETAEDEERVALFAYACKNFEKGYTDRTYVPEHRSITQSTFDDLKKTCVPIYNVLMDTTIEKAVSSNMDEHSFYREVWYSIVHNSYFDSEEKKVFVLLNIFMDFRIPYYPIERGLSMSESEYGETVDECDDAIQKAFFILSVDFPQKTMEASNLLDVILAQDEYGKQVVVLSKIIQEIRQREAQLHENNSEE